MRKRLYKNRDDRMLCGVCSGVADYFDIDPTIVRLLWAFLCLIGGGGIILYIIAAIIIPDRPSGYLSQYED